MLQISGNQHRNRKGEGSGTSAIEDHRPPYSAAPEVDEDEIDLGDLLGVLIENKWLIIGITLAAFALGTAYAFLATPIYQADGLLQVEEKSSGLGDLDINTLFEGDASVNAEIEILRSRSVLGTVVDNLNLDIRAEPDFLPIIGAALSRIGDTSERPEIQIDTLDVPETLIGQPLQLVALSAASYELFDTDGNSLLRGIVGETINVTRQDGESTTLFVAKLQADKGQAFSLQRQSRLKSIQALKSHLKISEKGKNSGILAITLEGADLNMVSRQVNEIADIYVQKNVERKSAEAEKTLSFLEEQLPVVKQNMETAEVALNTYRLEIGSINLPLETQGILETIVTAEAQLNELQQERDKVTQGFTAAHPMVIALDSQIGRLRGELDELNARVKELPNTEQEVLRLYRDVQVNTQLYTSLLNTAQELRVVKAGTVGNVRVVDYALLPYAPVKPKKGLVLLLSLLLGAFIGVAVAFARRALIGGVEDPDLIEKHVNIPVYSTIAHSKRQDRIYSTLQSEEKNLAILATDSPNDAAIESLRNLRTALHFGMMDVKNNSILIAGPSPTVGKSFISVNLAAVLTSNDKKVLLIDGDMRRGHLHQYLGLKRENGLSDFISGEIPIGQSLHRTMIRGLTFIPTGKIPPNPSELLLHKRFANCLSVLSPRFDHIIIDSPPILAVTDATIIGQLTGATLMVLKAGEHPMREIEQSVKRLQQAGVNLRGLLINDMNVQRQRYGAGKYNYQYSYSKN